MAFQVLRSTWTISPVIFDVSEYSLFYSVCSTKEMTIVPFVEGLRESLSCKPSVVL